MRYVSDLSAKLLFEVNGKSELQTVYEDCIKAKSLSEVVIASDSQVVVDYVKAFGGNVMLTRGTFTSETDICSEALKSMGGTINFDFVVHIIGNEPLVGYSNIDKLSSGFSISSEISSLFIKISDTDTLLRSSSIKVVLNEKSEAMYFSRSPIPHLNEKDIDTWITEASYYKHLIIYGFRSDILEKITKLPISKSEVMENIEALGWLSNGYSIKMTEAFY